MFALELGQVTGMDMDPALVAKIVPATFITDRGNGRGLWARTHLWPDTGLSETNPQGILFAGADQ